MFFGDGKAEGGDFLDDGGGFAFDVDGEVFAGGHRAGGDEGHDADEHFGDHGPVADDADIAFAREEFRRRTRGDNRVETRDRGAGDGDEAEREDRPRKDRPAPVDEAREGGHLEFRRDKNDGDREEADGPDFQERAQVIARGEQEPDGKDRGQQAVAHDGERESGFAEVEPVFDGRALDPFSADHGKEQTRDAEGADRFHAGPVSLHPEPHGHREGDGRGDGEEAPRAFRERLDHDECEHGEKDHHDREDAHQRDKSRERAHFVANHLAERFPAAADRTKEDDAIVDGTPEGGSDEDPKHARQVAELGGEHGADEGAGSRDGRKMVAEDDPLVCRHVVFAVILDHGGRRPQIIEGQNFCHEPRGMETIGDRENADGGDDHPQGVDVFTPIKSEKRNTAEADESD